ncbi:MAG: hypothetical protein K9M75_10530 [Phycisphaerae bacterium]|nr:hypothetical protein [Phycisphaerae bacterium]
MQEYTFYEIKSVDQLGTFDLSGVKIPVRSEVANDIFSETGVDLDLLVEELWQFINDNPDYKKNYCDVLSRLAYINALSWGKGGFPDRAAHYLSLGLDANPGNLSLRINYAIALQLNEDNAQALDQYNILFSDPDAKDVPILRMLAARLYAEKGQFEKAAGVLEACEIVWPMEDVYLEFLVLIQEQAGLPQEFKLSEEAQKNIRQLISEVLSEQRQVISDDAEQISNNCQQCNAEYKTGDLFCGNCGTRIIS